MPDQSYDIELEAFNPPDDDDYSSLNEEPSQLLLPTDSKKVFRKRSIPNLSWRLIANRLTLRNLPNYILMLLYECQLQQGMLTLTYFQRLLSARSYHPIIR